MKRTLAILLTAAAALTASAQDYIFNNPDNKAGFGVRLNYELACPTNVSVEGLRNSQSLFGNGSGFSVEGIYNIPVWQNLYFEPGFGIYYNTLSLNDELYGDDFKDLDVNSSARMWGFRIPLNIGYRFDVLDWLSLSFFTGPEINISFSGRTHFSAGKYSVNGPLYGKEGYLNRADIKWRFGVGATFNKHYTVAISGAAGMCDSMRDWLSLTDERTGIEYTPSLKMRSNLFTISLGYLF